MSLTEVSTTSKSSEPWNMNGFRLFISFLLLSLVAYTGVTIQYHGWNLFPVFFGDILQFGWPGQFNTDFSMLLLLSGLWVSWRHRFSLAGMVLGFLAAVGGALFLTSYLLICSFYVADVNELLLQVDERISASKNK